MGPTHHYYLILMFTTFILLASYAQSHQFPYESLKFACNKCDCKKKEDNLPLKYYVLDCSSRKLNQILDGYPDFFDLQDEEARLDISYSGNNITSLNQLPETKALLSFSCRHCGLKDISTAAFVDVPNIFKIDLSWNELNDDVMTGEKFKGRDNDRVYDPIGLVELDLSHNLLEILEHGLFEHLPGLRILKLTHNHLNIEHLSTIDALASLKYIEKLNLAYTGIATLPAKILNSRLIELNLYGNEFVTVPESLALSGTTLRLLNIGGNLIKELNDESLLGMGSLKHLHMSDMESLENIHHGTFTSVTSLESLYCFNNTNLKSVDIGSLSTLKNLRILDFSNCSLRTMQFTYDNTSDENANETSNNNDTTHMFVSLNSLKIYNNPWHCDCTLFKSLQKLMKFDQNDFQSENTARCSTPYELTSDLLIDITIDTMCLVLNNKKPRETVYDRPAFLRPRSILVSLLSILIVVLIGLCIGFAIVLIKKKLKQNEIGFSSPIRYTTIEAEDEEEFFTSTDRTSDDETKDLKRNRRCWDEELTTRNFNVVKQRFEPVLDQLKGKIKPIAFSLRSRTRNHLLSKGVDTSGFVDCNNIGKDVDSG